MLSNFFIAILISLVPGDVAGPELGYGTVLVYQSEAGNQSHQFVVRLARFRPDIVLEWESLNHQGTIHMFQKAVREGRKFSLDSLFEAGVDMESADTTVKWLPQKRYESLRREGRVKIKLNSRTVEMKKEKESTRLLTVNGAPVRVQVIEATDNAGGRWAFLADPNNPLLLEYRSKYYVETLERIATDSKRPLRWIRKLPPIR